MFALYVDASTGVPVTDDASRATTRLRVPVPAPFVHDNFIVVVVRSVNVNAVLWAVGSATPVPFTVTVFVVTESLALLIELLTAPPAAGEKRA